MIKWNYDELPIKYFYGKTVEYIDNAIKTDYESGRVASYQKNSRNKRKYTLTYFCDKARRDAFIDWYENTLGGNGVTFLLRGLENDNIEREYRFSEPPHIDGYQFFDITCNIEEA